MTHPRLAALEFPDPNLELRNAAKNDFETGELQLEFLLKVACAYCGLLREPSQMVRRARARADCPQCLTCRAKMEADGWYDQGYDEIARRDPYYWIFDPTR